MPGLPNHGAARPWAPLSLLGLLLALGVAACGDIDGGNQPFAGTTLYESAGKTYHLSLLEPPWLPVTLQGETLFLVPSSTLTVSVTAKESDALYSLHITPRSGNALTAFQTNASAQTPPWDLNARKTVTAALGLALATDTFFIPGAGAARRRPCIRRCGSPCRRRRW